MAVVRTADSLASYVAGFDYSAAASTRDTWHVLGMRWTGSTEFKASGALVPKNMAVSFCRRQVPAPLSNLSSSADLLWL